MAPQKQRVDPRPIKPPPISLLSSANNVVVGSDYDLPENVNPIDPGYQAESTEQKIPLSPTAHPAADIETPNIGASVLWIRGFSYRPEVCNGGGIQDPEATSVNAAAAAESQIDTYPYVVEGTDKRSTFGAPTQGEYEEAAQYAQRQLLACESKQIAQELWKGTLATANSWPNRYLAGPDVNLVEGDRLLGYVTSLAILERYAHDLTCGQQVMIHARADLVSLWDTGGALRRVGDLILTIQDSIVVSDAGYDGSAPAAGTAGLDPNHAGKVPGSDSSWAYATTVVDVRRSAFITPQSLLERVAPGTSQQAATTNLLTTRARRVAAATWGCLHIGIHADHTNSISTTGS